MVFKYINTIWIGVFMEAKNLEEIQKLVENIKTKRKDVEGEVSRLEADDIEPDEVLRYVNRLIAENWNLNREVSRFIKALEDASKSEERETKLITDVLTELLSSQRELVSLTEDAVERLKRFVTENPKESVDEIKSQIEFLKGQVKYYNHDYIAPSLDNVVKAIEEIHGELEEFYKKFREENNKLKLDVKSSLETNLNLLEKLAEDTTQLLDDLKSGNEDVLSQIKQEVDKITEKIDDVVKESKILRLKLENKEGEVVLSMPDLDDIQRNMYKYTQSLSQFIGYTNSRLEQIEKLLGKPGDKTLGEILDDLKVMVNEEKTKEGKFLDEIKNTTNELTDSLEKLRTQMKDSLENTINNAIDRKMNSILDKIEQLDQYEKWIEEIKNAEDVNEVKRIEEKFKKSKAYELYNLINEKKKEKGKKKKGFSLSFLPKKKEKPKLKEEILKISGAKTLKDIIQNMKPGEERFVEDIAKTIGKIPDEVIREFTELPQDLKQMFELRDYGLEADLEGKKPKIVRK